MSPSRHFSRANCQHISENINQIARQSTTLPLSVSYLKRPPSVPHAKTLLNLRISQCPWYENIDIPSPLID